MSRTTGPAIIAIVVGTTIACAGPRVSTEGPIEPQWYDQRAGCAPAQLPAELPAAAQVLDSAALLTALASQNVGGGESVLAIRFEAAGTPVPARVLESPLPQVAADSLAALLTTHLRAQMSGPFWGARVRVRHGAPQALTIERSVFCPPRAKPDVTRRRLPFVIEGRGAPPPPSPPRLAVLVSPDGRVTDVLIIDSSGDSRVDRSFEDDARRRRFEPARLDGAAVPAWFEIGPPR